MQQEFYSRAGINTIISNHQYDPSTMERQKNAAIPHRCYVTTRTSRESYLVQDPNREVFSQLSYQTPRGMFLECLDDAILAPEPFAFQKPQHLGHSEDDLLAMRGRAFDEHNPLAEMRGGDDFLGWR
eukprot:m.968763 g.968763  ORF g.968763 m.968763 type:complete len:127 (+) comp23919_c0_seq2:2027-2407(+)